jgi:hypothetical protein
MFRTLCTLAVALVPVVAAAQPAIPSASHEVDLAGPRFGVTMLSEGVMDKLREKDIHVGSTISQFGWQLEKQFYGSGDGVSVVNEWVALVGGLDQGVAIPSVSWLVGVRTKEGAEFGIGPNLTPAGVALAISAGVTFRSGIVNVPLNFAVVPTGAGTRVSVLTGFTLRR